MQDIQIAQQTKNKSLEVKQNSLHTISFNDLKNSINETFDGSRPIHGIRHFELIDQASEVLDKHNMNFQLDPIYAANNKSKIMPGISIMKNKEIYQDKEYPIENILFRRVLTRFVINDMSDELTNTAVGLNFHQNGVEIAFGANVHICQNMCLMGGDLLMSYGPNKTPLKNMFDTLSGWIKDFEQKRLYYQEMLQKMINTPFTQRDMAELAGWLTMYAVKKNNASLKYDGVPPLNSSQVNKIVGSYIEKYDEDPEQVSNLYQIYNLGTELYKPGITTMNEVFQANHSLGHFISKSFLS